MYAQQSKYDEDPIEYNGKCILMSGISLFSSLTIPPHFQSKHTWLQHLHLLAQKPHTHGVYASPWTGPPVSPRYS